MAWPFRVTDPLLEVLEVLLDADADVGLHGWAIMKQTRCSGPTVYQVLERLRKARWVEHWWEDEQAPLSADPPEQAGPAVGERHRDNVPRRRYYRLSAEGAARAPRLLAERGRRRKQSRKMPNVPGLVTFGRLWLFPGGARS